MKILFSFLLSISVSMCFAQKQFEVKGRIILVKPYCGGAAPNESQDIGSIFPVPYVGKKIYFRKGSENNRNEKVIRTVTADSNGNFRVKLPAGKYCLVFDEQVKMVDPDLVSDNKFVVMDKDCYEKWQKECRYTFEVKDAHTPVIRLRIPIKCFINSDVPCLNYTGPLPP